MEISNIAVEENSRTSDIDTAVSKSLRSLIQIESISIDLEIPMPKEEEGSCQHFSIRGYVAEMRKKDPRICSPFASTSDCSTISEEQLPPLDVPKFRWWQCKKCVHEICMESAGEEETEIPSTSYRSRLISANTASTSSAASIFSETKHESTSRKSDRDKDVMDASPNTSAYDFICKPSNGRFIEAEDKAHTAGNRTSSGNVRKEMITDPTIEVAISKRQCTNQETDRKSTGNRTSSGNVRKEMITDPTIEVAISKRQCTNQESDRKSTAADLSTNSTPVVISDSTLSGGQIVPYVNPHMSTDISPEKETTSPNDGERTASKAFEESNVLGSNDESLETSKTKLSRLPSLELRDYNEASSRNDKALVENRQCDLHNDFPNGLPRRRTQKVRLLTDILGRKVNLETRHAKAERNSSSITPAVRSEAIHARQDKGSSQKKRKMPQEDECNVAKRVRSSNGGAERSTVAIEIADSRSDEKESDGESIPSGTKILRVKQRNGTNKKKNKQLRPVDGYTPEIPRQDTTAKENIGSDGYGAVNSLLHPAHCSSMGENVEPRLRNNYQPSVGTGRNSNFLGESSAGRKNPVPVTTDVEMLALQPANELSAKVRLDLSLNSFRDSGKCPENNDSRNMTSWPFGLQKGNKSIEPQRKDNNININDNTLVGQSNVTVSGQSSRKGVICDLNQGISQTPSVWQEIQNNLMLLQKGNLHVPGTKETPHRHNEANLKGFTDHHRSQQSEKASDDIPMEIVELMAKNQYERGLTETNTKCTTQRTDGIPRAYPEIQESGAPAWSRPGVTSFHPANANMTGPAPIKLFGTFPQTPQKVSSGGNNGSASTHIRSGLQCREEARPVWFPTVQNMPSGLGIPQKCTGQPSDKTIHGQGRTISDIKCGDTRMQNPDLNTRGMGSSLDPYSNETIPAMQLLSLMDRRMPSSSTTPFNIEPNKLLEKPFSPCSYHPRFQMDGKQSILNGPYLSHHQFKESPGVHPGGYYADQISFQSRGQEKSRKSYAPGRLGLSKLERFPSSNGLLLSMTRDSRPKKDEQNGIPGTSRSRVQHHHNAPKFFNLEVSQSVARAAVVLPVRPNCETTICSLNRNPAEFSIPEEGNPYTWSIKDQRIRKRNSSREGAKTKRKVQRKEQGDYRHQAAPREGARV